MSNELTAPAPDRLRLSQPPPLHLDLDGDVAGSAIDWLPNQPAAASASDDDAWRAVAVVSLLSGAVPRTGSRSRSAIDVPPALVQFWDKGADVPHDVAECIDSWEQEVRILSVMLSRARHGVLVTWSRNVPNASGDPWERQASPLLPNLQASGPFSGKPILDWLDNADWEAIARR